MNLADNIHDFNTSLIRFGARDYDPQSARWTSKDPIKFNGDTLNIYRYVNNDPVNLIDPEGLQEMSNDEANEIIDDARDNYDTTYDAANDLYSEGSVSEDTLNEVIDNSWENVEQAQDRCAGN